MCSGTETSTHYGERARIKDTTGARNPEIICIRQLPIYIALALSPSLACVSAPSGALSMRAGAVGIKAHACRSLKSESYNAIGFKLAGGLAGCELHKSKLGEV